MKVKVTVYLKSGKDVSIEVICESMKELKKDYTRIMNSNAIVTEAIDNSSVQIIPTDNVDCINFERVED